jgi:hypothetical protein
MHPLVQLYFVWKHYHCVFFLSFAAGAALRVCGFFLTRMNAGVGLLG